jgi:hypothetical protein
MLPFFPAPYQDELLYSVLARYADRRLMRHSQLLLGLTGRRNTSIAYNFPTRIDRLLSVLPPQHSFTADYFIDNHTLFPFYVPFMTASKAIEVRALMKGGTRTAISAKVGINASRVVKNSHLRYCPRCVEVDELRHGFPYWHRSHQLPTIAVCTTHQNWLINSDVELRQTVREFISAERALLSKVLPPTFSLTTPYEQVQWNLAQDAQWILNQKLQPLGSKTLISRYSDLLIPIGLASRKGIPRINQIRKALKKRYTVEALERFGYLPGEDNAKDWIYRLLSVARQGSTQQPISHLLFLRFLGMDAATFFSRKSDLPLFSFF